MAKPINMPKLSDEMTEGKIAEWLKKEGDEVARGDVVAQVETEKATLDVEAFEAGVLIGVLAKQGDTVPVGEPIAWIGARGEKVPGAAPAGEGDAAKEARAGGEIAHVSTQAARQTAAKVPVAPAAPPVPERAGQPNRAAEQAAQQELPAHGTRQAPSQSVYREAQPRRVLASPAARRRAREGGMDLEQVEGSGPRGRVVLADLERASVERPPPERRAAPAAQATPAPAAKAPEPGAIPRPGPVPPPRRRRELPPRVELREETVPLSPMRRALARNLAVSKPGAPHFYLETSVDARRLVALRDELDEIGQAPVSLNDVVVKAAADALSRHPEMNAAWGADAIVRRGSIDVGVAVALDDGLVTPVVRGADGKTIFEVAREMRELAGRARARRLLPEEYQGASFTVSNLGMFGIEAFYAVINPPEAAILAVGAVQKVPWVDEQTGQVVPMERMRLGLSGDHRVVDGATGARFLRTLKWILESPVRLIVT
jgi:pyruvate dehydrogenase E2 component (dihydrolipoamide acetyltransferase)